MRPSPNVPEFPLTTDRMLLSAVLTFESIGNAEMPATCGSVLHGWLLAFIRASDPNLALALHEDRGGPQVFSVSEPLDPESRRPCRDLRTPSGARRWVLAGHDRFVVRVGSTEARLSTLLVSGLRAAAATRSGVKLGGARVVLVSAETGKEGEDGESALVDTARIHARFATILDEEVPRGFTVHFRTPTAFRSGGRLLLFPTPELLVRSLAARWNGVLDRASAGGLMETDAGGNLQFGAERIAAVENAIVVAGYDLRTEAQIYPKYSQRGFVGRCGYDLTRGEPGLRRAFGMLLDLAFFSGVGYKASMGMGSIGWAEHFG